jgi:RNA polymerase sigma-32 factor
MSVGYNFSLVASRRNSGRSAGKKAGDPGDEPVGAGVEAEEKGDGPEDDGDEVLLAEVIEETPDLEDDEDEGDDDDEDEGEGEIVDVDIDGEELPARGDRLELLRRDPLSAYIQETKRYPLLSREEEHELAVRLVEEGDTTAARRLIESNLRLVVKIAYEYRRAHKNLLDLVQEGNIGLMQAVSKYDPYRGVKLSSYAAWWIRAYILKFILNNWRLVKIGTTQAQRKLFFNLRKEKEKLEQLGFAPDSKLLAERLDVREKDVIEMEKRLAAPEASFDAPVGGSDGEAVRTRHDFVASESGDRPDVQVADSQFQELLKDKLETFGAELEGREETIFRERWLTESPLTLQEIGDRYGVSRERARQIEKRLMGRLRRYLESELGTEVDIADLAGR